MGGMPVGVGLHGNACVDMVTPDDLFLRGFLWGLGLGGALGALLVVIWYADRISKGGNE